MIALLHQLVELGLSLLQGNAPYLQELAQVRGAALHGLPSLELGRVVQLQFPGAFLLGALAAKSDSSTEPPALATRGPTGVPQVPDALIAATSLAPVRTQ